MGTTDCTTMYYNNKTKYAKHFMGAVCIYSGGQLINIVFGSIWTRTLLVELLIFYY